jgi:hypothetical protein
MVMKKAIMSGAVALFILAVIGCGGSGSPPPVVKVPYYAFGVSIEEKYEWTSDWGTPTKRTTYTYDSGTRTVSQVQENLVDTTDKWRTDYSYTGEGRISTIVDSDWDSVASHWAYALRLVCSYDVNGKETEALIQNYTGGVWTDSARFEYTYDGLLQLQTSVFSSYAGTWTPVSKHDYTYDGMGRVTVDVYNSNWTGSWGNPTKKYDYTYTGLGKVDSIKTKNWVGAAYEATYSYTTHFTYDGSNLVTREENGTGDILVPASYTMTYYFNYTYDVDEKQVDKIWGDPIGDHTKYLYTWSDNGSSYTKEIHDPDPTVDLSVYGYGVFNRYY